MNRRAWLRALSCAPLAGCEEKPQRQSRPQPLRLAIDVWPGFCPAVLADELGWLEPAGVVLSLAYPQDREQGLADFSAGKFDLMGASLGDLAEVNRGHLAAQVVMVTDESAGGDVLLSRKGVIPDPRRPLRIGTSLGGFGEVFLQEFLAQRHWQDNRWQWVDADAAEVPKLLAKGALDLGHTWEPYASQAVKAGATRLFSSLETPGLVADVLLATPTTLQRRGAVLRAFVRQWFRAVDWWLQHPAQAARLIADRVHVPVDTVSLEGVRLLDLADNRRLLGADGRAPQLDPVVRHYNEFFVNRGQLVRPLESATLLAPILLP